MSRFNLPLQAKLVIGFTLTLSIVSVITYRWFYRLASNQLIRHNQAVVNDILTAAMTGIDATDIHGLIREGAPREDGHSDDTRYWNLVSWLSLVASTNPDSQICVFLPADEEPEGDRPSPIVSEDSSIRLVGCSANGKAAFMGISDDSMQFAQVNRLQNTTSSDFVKPSPSDPTVWMRSVQPIQDGSGNTIAHLGVALESSDLRRLQASTLGYLTLTFVGTYLGLLVLTFGLSSVITRRVGILSEWASLVQQGNYDEKAGIPLHGLLGDELDDLAIAFQSMNQAVQSRETALKASEETLERQVRDRTRQLSTLLRSESTVRTILANIQASFSETEILQTAVNELGAKLSVLCANTGCYSYEKGITTVLNGYVSPAAAQYAQLDNGRVGSIFSLESWPVYDVLMAGQSSAFCPLDVNFPVAILACPICDSTHSGEHSTIADIWLFKLAADTFEPDEIQLANQVADVCAIAIRQSRLYQQTQERLSEVETVSQMKDDFLSTVSHELRTPITNMKMALQMLSMTMQSSMDDRQARYLDILRSEVSREADLINDLLDLQRLDAGGMGFVLEPIELESAIPQLLTPFESRANERHLHLETQIVPGLAPILSDMAAFKRIVSELVNNACKYTPAGERIVVAAYARVDANDYVTVSITNFGVQLPEEECDRIFDKFYRVPKSDVWKQGGTGLGLALVKGLVEQLSGAIAVESRSSGTPLPSFCPHHHQHATHFHQTQTETQSGYVRFSLDFPQFLPR